jgi:hypothetical protein
MGILVYVMQFKGRAQPEADPSRLGKNMASVAASISGPGGAGPLPTTTFKSSVTFTGRTSFQENGAVRFKAGHELRFRTIGEGSIVHTGERDVRHGWASLRVEGGFGEFEGAVGEIASNFLLYDSGEITETHTGTVFVK